VRRHWWVASIIIVIVLAVAISFVYDRRNTKSAPQSTQITPTENRYIDPSVCADCHPNIWETYSRTGMGRSFSRPTTSNTLGDEKKAVTYYHKASDSYFTMLERDGRFYQRRHQIGFDGNPTNIIEKEIDFVVGSGNHVRAYLHRTSRNTLVELPLAWYAENRGSWAMNPGYDRPDHPGFARAISYGCMFCHNGIPEIRSESNRSGVEPIFPERVPEGIDCQRCHGPGSKHVQMAESTGASVTEIRNAIVNPARLNPERQIEVCMQCHLQTTSFRLPNSIVRFDRGPFSYQPGEPLADFILHFDQAAGSGQDDKFEIDGAAYRLRRSACFQKSQGALRCTTCHNPHDIPRGEEAAAHYTMVCRQCHDSALTELISSGKHTKSGDCIGCHMPKRRTEDVVHVVMTDHYIQRRKPPRDLLAQIPERPEDENAYRGEVVLYYPQTLPEAVDRDLYLAVAQVSQRANLSRGIEELTAAIDRYHPARMEFYLQLADAWKDNGKMDRALPLYEEAVRRDPKSLIALQRLGFSLRSSGQPGRAVEILKQALALDTGDAATWHQLGLVYLVQSLKPEAITAFQKAIELDPDLSEAHNSLGGVWLESGDLSRAEPALREAIRIQPDYAEAHSNLANLLASTNRFTEARYHFEAAIRLKPDYAAAHYNYGVALARMNRLEDAKRQIEAALKSNPNFREAREALRVLQRLQH
jgi:predicted CXXCH cytochrome family protein